MKGKKSSAEESECFEGHFLASLITFTSNPRVQAALAMRERWRSQGTGERERRLLFLAIRQQLCLAIEDLGAHLYAFRERTTKGKDYLGALVSYRGDVAYLFNLFKNKSDSEIAADFGFSEIPPALKNSGYNEANNKNPVRNSNLFSSIERVGVQIPCDPPSCYG